MSYFSPAVICDGPYTLEAGQSLTLQYRVIIHTDRWDDLRVEKEYKRFVNPPSG